MTPLVTNPQAAEASESVELKQERSDQFNWVFFAVFATFHLGAIAALFFFHWSSLFIFLALWVLCQNVGVAVSYHRQLTHRSFASPKWVEYAMAICGSLALQGSPIYWVAVHRMHHQHADKPGDPHSPRDGKWWSHMGWILHGTLHSETEAISRYTPDLARDGFYRWLEVWHWLPITLTGIALLGIGTVVGRVEAGRLMAALGHRSAHHRRLPCYVAGELRNPSMGSAALRYPR